MKNSNGLRKIKNFCRNTYLVNKAINKKLRKIERRYKLKEGKLIKAKRLAIIAAAAAVPLTVGIETQTNEYVMYVAKDSIADEYIAGVPITDKNGTITTIPEGNLIVYEENINFGKKTVQAINSEGELVEGEIDEEYLEKIGDIKKDELEEHDTIYKVDISEYSNDSDEYLNIAVPLKEETDVTSKEKGKINNGSIVFGLPVYDTSKWIEVIYINDNKVVKGYMLSQYLKELQNLGISNQIEEGTQIVMTVDTSKDNNVDLNLRSEKKIGDNIIIKIPNGKEVTLITGEVEKGKSRDWYQVEYRDEENDKYYVGYVDASYLNEYGTIKMQVSTEKSDLNLIDKPNLKGKVIGKIKNGAIVEVVQGQGEGEWVKVKLDNQKFGYVNSQYLQKIEEHQKSKKNSDIKVSIGDGEILGIDALGIRQAQLSQMLKSSNPLGEVNAAYANKKIGFVYIKIGGCGYKNFRTTGIPEETIEQIKTCEEAGIPYGFYFYSTSRTNEEAKKENEIISQNMEEIGKSIDMKYNLLPLAIDIEIGHNKNKQISDRQHYSNWTEMKEDHDGAIESVTNAKAYLANQIEATTGERPMIYIGTQATRESDDKIFDINLYEEGVGYTPKIWYTAPYEENTTQMSTTNQSGINNMPKESVAIVQSTLDAKMNGVKVDVDRADSETLKELIGEEHIVETPQVGIDR